MSSNQSSSGEYDSEEDSESSQTEEEKQVQIDDEGGIFDGAELISKSMIDPSPEKQMDVISVQSEAVIVSSIGSDSRYKGSVKGDKGLS